MWSRSSGRREHNNITSTTCILIYIYIYILYRPDGPWFGAFDVYFSSVLCLFCLLDFVSKLGVCHMHV